MRIFYFGKKRFDNAEKVFRSFVLPLFLLSIVPTNEASASVVFYTTQTSFNAAAPGAALIENFSAAPTKNAPLSSLVLPSGTYTSLAGSNPNVFVSSPGYSNFGANVGTTTQYILTANGDENLLASLTTSARAVGFDAFFNGLGSVTVSVFGPGNTLLDAITISTGLDPATGLADEGYLGFTSTTPITGFQWNSTLGGRLNTGFTDISTIAAVPEPATWAMTLIGFAVIGFLAGYRRRRPARQRRTGATLMAV